MSLHFDDKLWRPITERGRSDLAIHMAATMGVSNGHFPD